MSAISNAKILDFLAARIADFNTEITKSKRALFEIFKTRVPKTQDQLLDYAGNSTLFVGRLVEIASYIELLGGPASDKPDESLLPQLVETYGADKTAEEKEKLQVLFRKFPKKASSTLDLLLESATYLSRGFAGVHPLCRILIAKAEKASDITDRNHALAKFNKYRDQGILSYQDYQYIEAELTEIRFSETGSASGKDENLYTLQRIVHLLSEMNEGDFLRAVEPIYQLTELSATFRSAFGAEEEVAERIYFHLYLIQKREKGDWIDHQDPNWGRTAFHNEGLATPQEKYRAAQRTYVEVLLSRIQDAPQQGFLRRQLSEFGHALDSRDVPPSIPIMNLPVGEAALEDMQHQLLVFWMAESP